MRPGLLMILNMKGDKKYMDPVTYRSRTIVRLLEILDEETFGEVESPFIELHDAIQKVLPLFYPLTGEEHLPQ